MPYRTSIAKEPKRELDMKPLIRFLKVIISPLLFIVWLAWTFILAWPITLMIGYIWSGNKEFFLKRSGCYHRFGSDFFMYSEFDSFEGVQGYYQLAPPFTYRFWNRYFT